MTSWAQRAREHFQQERQTSTTETTETPLSTVLTVQSGRFCEKHDAENQEELAVVIDIRTIRAPGLAAKLLAASMELDVQIQAGEHLPVSP